MESPEIIMNDHYNEFEQALLSLDRIAAKEIIDNQCEQSGAMATIEKIIVPALKHIGDGWEFGDLSLAQIYMSGKLCEEIIDNIIPANDPQRHNDVNMAIAVLEDHHTLGKNIIYSTLRANGFELIDYGAGISVDNLVEKVIKDGVEILLISVLMLRSALRVANLVEKLHKTGSATKVVVGGAPFRFDKQLYKEVGATASGNNSKDAINLVRRMVMETQNEY